MPTGASAPKGDDPAECPSSCSGSGSADEAQGPAAPAALQGLDAVLDQLIVAEEAGAEHKPLPPVLAGGVFDEAADHARRRREERCAPPRALAVYELPGEIEARRSQIYRDAAIIDAL